MNNGSDFAKFYKLRVAIPPPSCPPSRSSTMHGANATHARGAVIAATTALADRGPGRFSVDEARFPWMKGPLAAALALGISYQLMRTGHIAYIRSITSPGTRDLSLSASGFVAKPEPSVTLLFG